MKILIIGKNSRITQFLKEYIDKDFLYFEKYISSKFNTYNDCDY